MYYVDASVSVQRVLPRRGRTTIPRTSPSSTPRLWLCGRGLLRPVLPPRSRSQVEVDVIGACGSTVGTNRSSRGWSRSFGLRLELTSQPIPAGGLGCVPLRKRHLWVAHVLAPRQRWFLCLCCRLLHRQGCRRIDAQKCYLGSFVVASLAQDAKVLVWQKGDLALVVGKVD